MSALTLTPDTAVENIDQYIRVVKLQLVSIQQVAAQFASCNSAKLLDHVVNEVHDRYYLVVSILGGSPIQDYQLSWWIALQRLNKLLPFIKKWIFKCKEIIADGVDFDFTSIRNKVAHLYILVNETTLKLLNFTIHHHDIFNLIELSPSMQDVFSELIHMVLECCKSNLAVDCGLINNNEVMLAALEELLKVLFISQIESEHSRRSLMSVWFSAITDLAETTYLTGNPHTFIPLISASIITPDLPTNILKETNTTYKCVGNFYKYVAFNLFCLSINNGQIDSMYNIEADFYFKCFLGLPGSDYGLIPSIYKPIEEILNPKQFTPNAYRRSWGDSSKGSQEISSAEEAQITKLLTERQEVSLMYILNSTCMAESLEEVLNPSTQVKAEINSLKRTLEKSAKGKITNDVLFNNISRPNSQDSKNDEKVNESILKFQNPGSVLTHGTYMEKLTLNNLCGYFQAGKMDRIASSFCLDKYESNFRHLYEITDKGTYRGIIAFYEIVNVISRFIKLLQLKFFLKNTGSYRLPQETVTSLLCYSPLEDVLQSKRVLACTIKDNGVHEFSIYSNSQIDYDSMVKHQIDLKKSTKNIEKLIEVGLFN